MNWFNKLSFKGIILLTPIITFVLMILSFSFFLYTAHDSISTLENLQNKDLERSRIFLKLGEQLANNHVRIYEHLRFAEQAVDEGEFYDKGKLYLIEIHNIKDRVINYVNANTEYADIKNQLAILQNKLTLYQNSMTNAILMATVDLNLAKDRLRESTQYYISLNSIFIQISELIQKRISVNSSEIYDVSEKKFLYTSVFTILALTLLIFISFRISKKLSSNLRKKILALESIFTGENHSVTETFEKNEIDILSNTITYVKDNVNELEILNNNLNFQEKQLRTTLDNMMDGVITIDEVGTVLSYNKAAEKIFGYFKDEVIGQNVSVLMPESLANEHDQYLKNYFDTGVEKVIDIGRETIGKRKNDEVFPMQLSVSKLPIADGSKQSFIGSIQDLTLLKQKEEQLQRSQKMDAIGKLTGGIAHDFNNMLGVILGYTEILEMDEKIYPKIKNYIDEIKHSAERGAKLTKKLLSFSRKKSSTLNVTNINGIILENKLMIEKTITPRIKLLYEQAEDLWLALLDSSDLEDAILNLCINSMHSIKEEGQITIATSNERLSDIEASLMNLNQGDYILLTITDTGCGIASEEKNKIFEPFYTTKGEKGTGLGLSQVYGFITRSNGAIKVYSEVEQGTRMALYFPRNHRVDEKEEDLNDNEITTLSGSETILIVDDEDSLLSMTSEILKKFDYNVICAHSAKQALEILVNNNSIDLLLSDVIMPEMNGYQLVSIVKEKYPDIKIQLASGFSDDRHMELVSKELYSNMLHKPYSSKSLLQAIRKLLDEEKEKGA